MSSSDWIFKNRKFVGDFEALYQNEKDPWNQSTSGPDDDSRRVLAVSHCERMKFSGRPTTTVELGCGFGLLSNELGNRGFQAHGIDISKTAIDEAQSRFNSATFHNFNVTDFVEIRKLNPDIFLMVEITWYILPELRTFIRNLRDYSRDRGEKVYLFHSLTTYPPGVQTYGLDYFTNHNEILTFFNLNYLEHGTLVSARHHDSISSFFFAEVNAE